MLAWSIVPVETNAQSTIEDTIEKLQGEIRDRSNRLSEIEQEIAKYESELKEVGAEKKTLQSAISQLEIERKRVQADIAYTEQKIRTTDLEISKLVLEIDDTEEDIEQNKAAISEIIRQMYVTDSATLVEVFLAHDRFSDFFAEVDRYAMVQEQMAERVALLEDLEATLVAKRDKTEDVRGDLVSLKDQYSDKNSVLVNNKAEQSQLLAATKNEEANYQKMLKEKQAAREQILKEVRAFESQLQFALDPTTIPAAGTAVFAWPLKSVVITQYFGGTEFAARNAGVYGGRAYHPGVDFGVPRGSAIYAPLAGTVRATGNTDAVPGCYSWGKWTLVDHANGLSTLYAHQDTISVVPGQRVATGEIIGYTGNTGYSTGPHLHFTVYAKDGVSVRQFNQIKSVTSCGAATTPVAATEAYLDPMQYLPAY